MIYTSTRDNENLQAVNQLNQIWKKNISSSLPHAFKLCNQIFYWGKYLSSKEGALISSANLEQTPSFQSKHPNILIIEKISAKRDVNVKSILHLKT
jgi:hypothetical protein